MEIGDWKALLVCPICKGALHGDLEQYCCDACGQSFARENQVIWFLAEGQGDRRHFKSVDGAAMVSSYRQPKAWVSALRRVISSEYFPGRAWRQAKAKALATPGHTLIIGSGISHYPGAIHLDLDDFPGVNIVADAHALPFKDQSIDAVICEVVLEHAAEPQQILSETRRVLKPGGHLFFVVPFVFPYHGHPADYRRWSRAGLAQDFAFLHNLEIGMMGGPCSSMVNLMSEWVYILTGLRFPKGYTLVKGGATALLFPLKFLDILVNRFPEAHRLASTLYVTGQAPK